MRRIFTLLFFFVSAFSFAQVDLNLGLGAYYPFTGNANDASGNNNNPSFNNATLTADHFGNANSAYHFNGINNYMRIPNSPTINSSIAISVCAWINVTGFYYGPCHGNGVLNKGDDDYLPGNYILRFDEAFYTPGCGVPLTDTIHQNFRGGAAVAATYTPYIQKNQWYSVVFTYDGTTAKLYVNCELKYALPTTLTFTNSYDLFLGRLNNPQYPYWFNGDLDEVRIYNRAINQDEVNAYGGCGAIANCNNWLSTQAVGQSVKIGDLDVSGNQITVEAQINRTAPYSPNYLFAGDIVSKHDTPSDANYLLRPNDAEITTTNGYAIASANCEIELNKTYHVALVYNGSTLRFYRNGFLMDEVPASGNLIQNSFTTTIGDYAYPFPDQGTNFAGYINEVRIWNVDRTQAQLQTYMNSSLPNPASQTGLLAYYTFDDLTNKQGNPAWNGTMSGAATINTTNPDCVFLPDSCNGILPVILTDFKASVVNNKKIVLTWNTENELSIKDYYVQRSTTGYAPDFITIGTVASNGNAHSNKYSFTDNTAKPNTLYYYRLLINDLDGSRKPGPTRTARITNRDFYTLVYPNPTDGIVKVFINNAVSDVHIKVMNNLGQLITEKKSAVTNTYPVLLDISQAAKGMYWVIIESETAKYVEKIIKQK